MLIALALALATDASPAEQRADFQRFSARLEQRLSSACRPAEPMVFLSGLPETRFVYLDGEGAIFLLPPRSLPVSPPPPSGRPAPEISVSGSPSGPQVLAIRNKKPTDLTDLEARIRETRREAERMRAQADAAFADAERQLMAELRPGLSESMTMTTMSLSGPLALFLEDAPEDMRSPEQVEMDVKDALIATMLEDSLLLKSLQPADTITTSVDLVSRPQPWVRAKPARTLVVRAQKTDLDAFSVGKLSKEDLLKRIQTKAY